VPAAQLRGLRCRCQSLNLFFAGNALAFSFSCFICLLTVKSVIHQQGHFVVRLNTSSQLPIELFIHGQRFGVKGVHGFFGLNAFLLGFPFSQRAAHFIFQRIETLTDNAAAFVDLLWQRLQLSDQVFTCVVDVGFRARDLVSHGCDSVTAFLVVTSGTRLRASFSIASISGSSWSLLVKTAIAFFFSMTTKSIISLMVSPEIWL
jgi:hypothetical protein